MNKSDHYSAHVALWNSDMGLICGITSDTHEISTFGGLAENNETVLQTIVREFQEETLGILFTNEQLISILHDSQHFVRKSDLGNHYNFYVVLDTSPDIDHIRREFVKKLEKYDLPEYREHEGLTMIPQKSIQTGLSISPPIFEDIYGQIYPMREPVLAALRYFEVCEK